MTGRTAGRWLDRAAARAALAATGVLGRRATSRFSRLDAVADVGGVVAAFELLEPPVVSRTTVRIHAVEPGLMAGPALRRATAMARQLSADARVQLRSAAAARARLPAPELQAPPGAQVLAAAGFAPFLLWIRKTPQPAREVPGAEVRYARSEADWAFVAQCHRDALRNGMPTTVFTDEALDRYVHGALRIARRGRPEALVCRVDGTRTGQVTWRTVTDRWTGAPAVDVIDVFVLPDHLRGPTGAALNAALEREVGARRPGLQLLGNVVAEGGTEWRVLERLSVHGWELDHVLWQLR